LSVGSSAPQSAKPATTSSQPEKKAEAPKKEEKPVEEEEVDMGAGGLFGDDFWFYYQ